MEIVFLGNFVVSMLQILIGESEYRHKEILTPSFTLAFLIGLFVGCTKGWQLALIIFALVFVGKFFVASLRIAWMLRTQTEIGSRYYWKFFAIGALVETAAVWALVKNL